MFALIQLKTATLDIGVPGMPPLATALALLLMFGVPMIPYAMFYLSLREKTSTAPFAKLIGWAHIHHPQPVHH